MTLTLVTMLFDINKRNTVKRRSVEEYLKWGKSVLNLEYDMVIYCEPDLVDRIKKLRTGKAKTEIIPMLFEELPQHKWLECVKQNKLPINTPSVEMFVDRVIMGWSKLQLLNDIANRNPFNSSHSAFIDLGISHAVHNWIVPEAFTTLLNKVRFHILRYADKTHVCGPDFYHKYQVLVAFGYVIGPNSEINNLSVEFNKEIPLSISSGAIDYDEVLLARVIAQNPEKYIYSYGDYTNIFTNHDGIHYGLNHINWMMADAREKKGWQFICELGAEVLKSYNNGTLQYSGNELELALSEYFIGAYWANKIEIANEIAYLYSRLLDTDHNFYYSYARKAELIRTNFSYLSNPPEMP